jgi:hypothetical protein
MLSLKPEFVDYTKFTTSRPVHSINGMLFVLGIGRVSLAGTNGESRMLQNVLHIPGLKEGLLSLTRAALEGFEYNIKERTCTIASGTFRLTPQSSMASAGLLSPHSSPKPQVVPQISKPEIVVLDLSVPIEAIVKLDKSQMVKGWESSMHTKDDTDVKSCVGCQKGKQHRLLFPSVSTDKRRDEPGELIHSDLFGPIPLSIGRNKYGITYMDDATRECQVLMIS